MCRTKIFLITLAAVTKETEICSAEITSGCRRAEVVDARCILVHFLFEKGLNASEISKLINVSPHSVRRLHKLFDLRVKLHGNLIRQNADAIRTKLEHI